MLKFQEEQIFNIKDNQLVNSKIKKHFVNISYKKK